MRFYDAKYSTIWQKLNIGIMMCYVISALMEMLLRSTKDTTIKITVPSMKFFLRMT